MFVGLKLVMQTLGIWWDFGLNYGVLLSRVRLVVYQFTGLGQWRTESRGCPTAAPPIVVFQYYFGSVFILDAHLHIEFQRGCPGPRSPPHTPSARRCISRTCVQSLTRCLADLCLPCQDRLSSGVSRSALAMQA